MYLWAPYLWQRKQKYNGEKTVSSISTVGKLNSYMWKNEIRTLANTIHKKKLKWIKDLSVKSEIIKLQNYMFFLEENIEHSLT